MRQCLRICTKVSYKEESGSDAASTASDFEPSSEDSCRPSDDEDSEPGLPRPRRAPAPQRTKAGSKSRSKSQHGSRGPPPGFAEASASAAGSKPKGGKKPLGDGGKAGGQGAAGVDQWLEVFLAAQFQGHPGGYSESTHLLTLSLDAPILSA